MRVEFFASLSLFVLRDQHGVDLQKLAEVLKDLAVKRPMLSSPLVDAEDRAWLKVRRCSQIHGHCREINDKTF